jgi:hypothetical protein
MMRSIKLVLVVLAGCSLAGCAAAQDESPPSSEDSSELRASTKTEFYCGREGYDFDLTVKLSAKGSKLHVEWGLDNIVTGEGTIDPSYRPRAGNASFVRFTGFAGLDDAFGQPPTSTKILVEKPLLEGKAGRVKLQFVHANDEFEQSDNACFTAE